jgi:hypothetical protein
MGNEELLAVKKQLAAMKKIELTGFTNTETATCVFSGKGENPRVSLKPLRP